MTLTDKWKDVEEILKKKDSKVNVFYTKEYNDFEKFRGNKCIYLFNEYAIILVIVWKRLIYSWGVLPSEPIYFMEADEQVFLDEALNMLKETVYWINQTNATANFKGFPTKSKRIPFGNYICNLTIEQNELFAKVNSKARNMIRKAEKDGVEIVSGGIELLDEYIKCDVETWERSGVKRDAAIVYEQYLTTLNDHAIIYLAKKGGIVQGGALFIYNKIMSYYMYGASISRPSPGSMNLLQWKAMLDFKSKGVQYHNFVGCRINEDPDSKYHGIQRFKASFGGDLLQGYMFKTVLNNLMYKQFKILELIRHPLRKRTGDIIDQEIHKWKDLNN